MWPTAPPCFTLIIQLVPHPTRNKFLTDSAPWHHWCLNCLLVVNVALGYNASARKRKKYSQSFPYLWQGTSDNLASAKFIMNGNTSPCPKLTVRESNSFVNNKTKVLELVTGVYKFCSADEISDTHGDQCGWGNFYCIFPSGLVCGLNHDSPSPGLLFQFMVVQ